MCLAVPGKITSIDAGEALQRMGKVSFGGVVKDVHLGCVPEAKPGDYVIVHAGVAISILDEAEAAETLRLLREIAELSPGEHPAA
jgi:hydrogenase expression/formation protein HypC